MQRRSFVSGALFFNYLLTILCFYLLVYKNYRLEKLFQSTFYNLYLFYKQENSINHLNSKRYDNNYQFTNS